MRLLNLLLFLLLAACSSQSPESPKSPAPAVAPEHTPRPKPSPAPMAARPAPARPMAAPMPAPDAIERSRDEVLATQVPERPRIQPAPPVDHKAKKELKQLTEKASLAFSVTEQANIREKAEAQLIVDIGRLPKDLVKELNVKGSITQAQVLTTKVISAQLSAPAFDVSSSDLVEQAIIEGQPAVWKWKLKPKSAGKFDVTLTVYAKVRVDGVERSSHIKTFEKVVQIEITNQQRFEDWLDEHWESIASWLWTSAIVPLLIYWWHHRRRRSKKR